MSDTTKLKEFVKGSSILVFSNVCVKAINFFLLPLYTANLTPNMLGISDTITTFTGFLLPLLVMGFDSAFSAFYFDKNDADRGNKVFNTILWTLFIHGVLALCLIAFSKQLSELLFKTADYSEIIIISLVSVTFNIWYIPFNLQLRLKNKMLVFGMISVFSSLSLLAFNILFVSIMQLGEYSLILSSSLSNFLILIVLLYTSRKDIHFKRRNKRLKKTMLKYAIPMVPVLVAMWILSLSDRYILLYYYNADAVGIYGIGSRFVTLINVIISAVNMAYTTFAFSNIENVDAKKQYSAVLNVVYIVLIGTVFTVSIFSKEIIGMMTSPEYIEAYKPLRDMMFGQIFYGIASITSYGIYFKKKSSYAAISTTIAAIVNIILNFIFIPQYGIAAAAATTLIAYGVMFVINYVVSQKLYHCNYDIKRILFNMAIIYLIALFGYELSIKIKIILWIISALLTIWMFRKQLFSILELIKNRRHR